MTLLDREHLPATRRWAYLNHAGICPLPQPSVDAMHRRATEVSLDGEFTYAAHSEDIERVRSSTARLMGVPARDLAFVKDTSSGLGFVANGLDWSLLGAGVEKISAHVAHLCAMTRAGLTELGATILSDRTPDHRSGIVTVHVDWPPIPLLAEQLRARGGACSTRAGGPEHDLITRACMKMKDVVRSASRTAA